MMYIPILYTCPLHPVFSLVSTVRVLEYIHPEDVFKCPMLKSLPPNQSDANKGQTLIFARWRISERSKDEKKQK